MGKKYISESLKNVTKISSGTVAGQIISIITLPILTRLYGAEVIGIWTVINSFSNIVQNICDLGLSNSLMMCKQKEIEERYSIIIKLSCILSIISSAVIFVYYLIIGENIKYALTVCGFLAVYAFTLRRITICTTILNRNKEYDVLMKNSVIRFGSTAIVAIVLGEIGFLEYGYYIGNVIGQIITVVHMRKFLPRLQLRNKTSDYVDIFKNNFDYIRYQMPASITVTLRTELPNLLIGGLFGNTMLGYFAVSQKLLTIPVTFLGQALGKVFFQRIAEMKRTGKQIGEFVERNINRGMLIALVPMTLLAAFGDAAIVLFFGEEYSIGGVICRIIVYRSLFNFISSATQGIDIVLDKQKYVLYTCLAQTVLAVISVLCGYYVFDSIYATSVFLAGTFILVQIVYFYKMYGVMQLNSWKYVRNMILVMLGMFLVSTVLRYGVIAILHSFPIGLFKYLLKLFVM